MGGVTSGSDSGRRIENAQRHQQYSHVLKPEQGRLRRLVEAGKKHVRGKDRRNGKTEIEEDSKPHNSPKPLCACAHRNSFSLRRGNPCGCPRAATRAAPTI